jgi:hypothetical protein
MIELAKTQPFYGLQIRRQQLRLRIEGRLLAANIAYALERPRYRPAMRAELKRCSDD